VSATVMSFVGRRAQQHHHHHHQQQHQHQHQAALLTRSRALQRSNQQLR
jgi:hypothetical protein